MPTDLPKNIVKLIVALLKNLLGKEAIGIAGEMLIDIGGEKAQASLEEFLSTSEGSQELINAALRADEYFRKNCTDDALRDAFTIPMGDLPGVQQALKDLPQALDEDELLNTIHDLLHRDFPNLTEDQLNDGSHLYLNSLHHALLPLKKFTLSIIGQTVFRSENKIDQIYKNVAELRREKDLNGDKLPAWQPETLPDPDTLPDPAPLPPGSRIAYNRNAVFTGRENDLRKLADALLYSDQAGKVSVSQIAAATGLGGIGKTQLAVEFCYRYGRFFKGIHWISVTSADIAAEVAECGRLMDLHPWPDKNPDQVAVTLHAWSKSQRRLVVLDNAEDLAVLQDWLPQLHACRVLITSRQSDWPADLGLHHCKLGLLSRPESIELLRKLAPRLRDLPNDALNPIADKLGDLPLALHLAGCYLKDRERLSPQGFLDELEKQENLLDHTALLDWTERTPTDHEVSLAANFHMSWNRLAGQSESETLSRALFQIAGWCAPNAAIPVELLMGAAGVEAGSPQEVPFDRALNRLHALGLLDRSDAGPLIHPLLAAFAQKISKTACDDSYLSVLSVELLKLVTQSYETRLPINFLPLRPHLELVCKISDHLNLSISIDLWNTLGMYLIDVAEFNKAKSCIERALVIAERVYGNQDLNVAGTVNNLGLALKNLGDLTGAKACFERAFAIYEHVCDPNHPGMAQIVNNLGRTLQDLGELDDAKPFFERALEITEQYFGADDPQTAVCINNLGRLLQDMGDFDGAKENIERALTIAEHFYGFEHPDVAIFLNNLGGILLNKGDPVSAKPYFERALAITKNVYGDNHPNAAIQSTNLGNVLIELGDQLGAKACLERALVINQQFYNADHPNIATSLNNLGNLLYEIGDKVWAKDYIERAFVISEKFYGPEHPNVGRNAIHLGLILRELGDLSRAKIFFERALAINERVLGFDHPEVAIIENYLGNVLKDLGDIIRAKAHFERAVAIADQSNTIDHSNTVVFINNLGIVLYDMGNLIEAKECYERAIAIANRSLNQENADVAGGYSNLGTVLQASGDLKGAKVYYTRALRILEKSLPTDHPKLQIVQENLKILDKEYINKYVETTLEKMGVFKGEKVVYKGDLRMIEETLHVEKHKIKIIQENLIILDHRPTKKHD